MTIELWIVQSVTEYPIEGIDNQIYISTFDRRSTARDYWNEQMAKYSSFSDGSSPYDRKTNRLEATLSFDEDSGYASATIVRIGRENRGESGWAPFKTIVKVTLKSQQVEIE